MFEISFQVTIMLRNVSVIFTCINVRLLNQNGKILQ